MCHRERGGGGEGGGEREGGSGDGRETFSAWIISAVCFLDIPLSTVPLTDTSSSPGHSDPSSYAGVR